MDHVITVDFGSTFTKVVVIDLAKREILLSDKVPSSVGTDAAIGLNQCFALAKLVLSEKEFEKAVKLASSSAAGGLRMAVIGLTDSLSTLAGKSAALGAGAKVIANYSGCLNEKMIEELESSNAEIILFCGGYEHGNTSLVRKNAEALAGSAVRAPIIYAGNSDVGREIRAMMKIHGKQCFLVENMIPKLGTLNVEPVQGVIRNLFLERITDMKGFHSVKREFDNPLIPTPAAVLAAGELLNRGTNGQEGLGALLIVDIGGATTDVYSFSENKGYEGAVMIGLEEPFGKRTVEGDLGMRESSGGVINAERISSISEKLKITEEQLKNSIRNRMENIDYLPDCETEKQIDFTIAKTAVYEAVRRHAGRVTPSYNKKCQNIQIGKNLSEVGRIIGTGGVLVHSRNPSQILKASEKNREDKNIMLPNEVQCCLDSDYVLFSAGLLREIDEEAAIAIMMKSIKQC